MAIYTENVFYLDIPEGYDISDYDIIVSIISDNTINEAVNAKLKLKNNRAIIIELENDSTSGHAGSPRVKMKTNKVKKGVDIIIPKKSAPLEIDSNAIKTWNEIDKDLQELGLGFIAKEKQLLLNQIEILNKGGTPDEDLLNRRAASFLRRIEKRRGSIDNYKGGTARIFTKENYLEKYLEDIKLV